jgi:hypothetical protein
MAGNPNPSSALLWFFIVTTLFFIIKYNIEETSILTATVSYILLIAIGEFCINLSLTNEMCGEAQWGTAFSITLVPWLIVFGLLNLMLNLFPGWKTPFSNTFGYGMALMGGLTPLMKQIFKDPADIPSSEDAKAKQTIQYIYHDQSLLINEIGQGRDKFNEFWDSMISVMKSTAKEDPALKKQLESIVNSKYITAEYIWYMLAGTLVTSISYNYLVNIGCDSSAKKMLDRREAYNRKMKEKEAEESKKRLAQQAAGQ